MWLINDTDGNRWTGGMKVAGAEEKCNKSRPRSGQKKRSAQRLERQNEYLSLLHETALGLLDRQRVDELLEKIISQACRIFGTEQGYIYLVEDDEKYMEMKVGNGFYRGWIGSQRKKGMGIAGKTWEVAKMVYLDDYLSWPHRNPDSRFDQVYSAVALPLQSGGRVIGVLGLDYYDSSHRFNEEELDGLARLANLASLALDNAILYTSAQRELAERKQMEAALASANDQLEVKVEMRTQELMAMNEELIATNQELFDTLAALREMQAQLVQAEKMAALGILVAGVAHEINTPVGIGVMLSSHLALEGKRVRKMMAAGRLRRDQLMEFLDECEEATTILHANLQRTAQLVQGFKQVSVDQANEVKRAFNMKEYLDEIVRGLRLRYTGTRHQIKLDCPDELVLEGYPGGLAQIVINLVTNSMVHAFSAEQEGLMEIQVTVKDDQCELVYRDNGRGIAEDVLPRIFDPFFTTNRGGGNSGLGLHILFNVVTQQFGGTVHCTSEIGRGVLFLIRFPIRCTMEPE